MWLHFKHSWKGYFSRFRTYVVARFQTKIALAAGIGEKQDNGSLPPERLLRTDGNPRTMFCNGNVVIY
jgi:hypothetical protein